MSQAHQEPSGGERDATPSGFEWLGQEAAALLTGATLPDGDIALTLFSCFPREELAAACPRARLSEEPETVLCATPGGCIRVTARVWRLQTVHSGGEAQDSTTVCISVTGGDGPVGVIKAAWADELAGDTAAAQCLRLAARALGRLWEAHAQAGAGVDRRTAAATPGGEDRQRLSVELHDGLAQTLTAALHYLQMYRDPKYTYHQQRAEMLPRAEALLRKGLAETRSLISMLRRPVDKRMSLGAILKEEARRLKLELGCPVEFRGEVVGVPIPSEVEVALYRVAFESLNNVRRHAAAKRVRISLSVDESGVKLVVQDWGCGFDPSVPLPPGRGGLAGMRRRMQALEGSLEIRSVVGVGTTVTATVPLRMRG